MNLPPLGLVLLAIADLIVLMILCFYKLDTASPQLWPIVGLRTGFITASQFPLIVLLSGKNNLIGILTGTSHERLNWLHRSTSRMMWLVSTIHMTFWFRHWGQYSEIAYQLRTSPVARRGLAAWVALTFMLFVSFVPVRRLGYDVFVVVHLLFFGGFIAIIWYHTMGVQVWLWISVGLFLFDRLSRFVIVLWANIHLRPGKSLSRWASTASMTPLPGNVTRITISNPATSWRPGQHAFVSCHTLAPFQSHPFTIASIPQDGELQFFVRARNGATRRFFEFATHNQGLPGNPPVEKAVVIEGPYGRMRPLRQFDTVVFIAGGIGATLVVPLMRDIVAGWKDIKENQVETDQSLSLRERLLAQPAITRRIHLIWVVRSQHQLDWFADQLQCAVRDVEACRAIDPTFDKELDISIYVNCDKELADAQVANLSEGPARPKEMLSVKQPEKYQISHHSSSAPNNDDADATKDACAHDSNGCCCMRTITDENVGAGTNTNIDQSCIRSNQTPKPIIEASSALTFTKSSPPTGQTLNPSQKFFTGHPNTRQLLRTALERAHGESGAVVCGPPGLGTRVRGDVVTLSDERAVHKGTGAQGIYLHCEAF